LQLQVRKLLRLKVKNEVRRETLDVPVDLLIQPFGRYAVHLSEIRIEQRTLAPDAHNARNDIRLIKLGRRAHRRSSCIGTGAIETRISGANGSELLEDKGAAFLPELLGERL